MNDKSKKSPAYRKSTLGKYRQTFVIAALALVLVVVLVATFTIIQFTEQRSHAAAEKLVSEVIDHVNAKLDEVKAATLKASEEASAQLNNPAALEVLVREFVENNSFVYGSTVAFEPYVFPELGRCFAPYSWLTADGQVHSRQLGTETDYYEEEWYAETKRTGQTYWCEPYFDEGGAKIMMCTFSVPLMDDGGELIAIMTADVGLEDLEGYVDSIRPNQESYIVLRSVLGAPLTNENVNADLHNMIIVKGRTEIGWSVELNLPFTDLMRGDTSIYFFIGAIFLFTILFVYFINRVMIRLRQRASEEYMNVIDSISSSFSSIFLVNLLNDETVIYRNPKDYEGILEDLKDPKPTFGELLSRLINCDCLPADRDKMFWETATETIRKKLAEQDRYAVRFRKEKEGISHWFEMMVFILERSSTGTAVRAVIGFTDVNESVLKEKESQDTLEQALVTAQSASKAKTDFLFNMSHDIRTPMNAIIGFTNMAKKHVDDREKVLDCLNKTQQSGNLLLTLINSVLDVSRIEAGHAKLEESPADVEYSFKAVEDTLKELAATRDIAISFEIGEIRNRYVFCDLVRCNRIFVNIISNAIKYTNPGGQVKIRCTQIESDREGFGNYRYIFEDNGIGMSEEFQKKVFDQFARERSTTVSGIEGSGLGLAVVKSFVDLMGGTIECQSQIGVGTTFTVTLPFRLQEGSRYVDPISREEINALEEKENRVLGSFRGKKVLLVEDNELNREIAEEILEEEGMTVESAENGAIAVDLVRENGATYYDFILMDIQMPVMNGFEATKAIRELYPEAKLPIIALSANAFEEDKSAALAAGMNDHVAKPINLKELYTVLGRNM